MDLLSMLANRRSIRTYTGEAIPEETLNKVVEAGLLAFSGRNIKPWQMIVVRDKEMLQKLSKFREHGPGMLAGADAAIVVVADKNATDVWTEDASIVMTYLHLAADMYGLGSCRNQGRLRMAPDGRTGEEYVRELLGFPEDFALEAMLSLGMIEKHTEPREFDEKIWEKVHKENW